MTSYVLVERTRDNFTELLTKISSASQKKIQTVDSLEKELSLYFEETVEGLIIRNFALDEVLSFIQRVTETQATSFPFAVISSSFGCFQEFEQLKRIPFVRFVLPQNLSDNQTAFLVANLGKKSLVESDSSLSVPEKLLVKYENAFFDKYKSFESLLNSYENNPSSKDVIEQFLFDIHKLTGSASAYGYKLMSLLCHQLEERLRAVLTSGGDISTLLDPLQQFMKNLKLTFQHFPGE